MDSRSMSDHTVNAVPARGFNAPLWIVLGALVLTVLLYWPTSVELTSRWGRWSEPYAHGWVVLAVTIWLIWRDRANLTAVPLRPPVGGWLLVALGSVAWFIGYSAGLMAATVLALPMLVLVTVWAAGGMALTRRVAVPLLLLYAAVPIWEVFGGFLQCMTAEVNGWLASVVGIPATMQEYVIHIPAGSFAVEGGCSGLNYFVTAVFIAVVLGEIDRDDLRSRLLLIGIAAALAIVINWLRVFAIIVAGHLTNMQHYLVRVDHYKFGWVLFAFVLVFYFWLASRLPRRSAADSASAQAVPIVSGGHRARSVGLTVIALAIGPVRLLAQELAPVPAFASVTPPVIPGWVGPERYLSDWRPAFANADKEFLVAYIGADKREVAVCWAAYHSQRQGKELRGYGNSTAGPGRRVMSSDSRQVTLNGHAYAVTEQVLADLSGVESVVWFLYAVDGQPDPMGLTSQLAYGLRSLWDPPTASVVALAADCRPDCAAARASLESMAPKALPLLLEGQSAGTAVAN